MLSRGDHEALHAVTRQWSRTMRATLRGRTQALVKASPIWWDKVGGVAYRALVDEERQ